MSNPNSPHDALFRWTFRKPQNAAGLIKHLLPPSLVAAIDWRTLNVEPGTLIDKNLALRHTDLLFSVRLKNLLALILAVVEHQSDQETIMGLRMAGYSVRALEDYVKEQGPTRTLPPIIALVVSHCRAPWSAPQELFDLFAHTGQHHRHLAPLLPRFHYLVDDLSGTTEADLRRRALSADATLTLLALREVRRTQRFLQALYRWTDLLPLLSPADLTALLTYILKTGTDPTDTLKAMLSSHVSQEAGELVMTTGQQLIEEGIQRGRKLGIDEGRQMEITATAQLLRDILRAKFPEALSLKVDNRIATASLDTLRRWSLRTATARSLDEVFAD